MGAYSAFYLRYGWFQMRERFTDLASSVGYLLLYPFFIWLLTQVWAKFNAYQGTYRKEEVFVYIAILELLFMTFVRSSFMQRSNADFSTGLARPRSWLGLTFFGQMGATLGGRLVYSIVAIAVLLLMGLQSQLIALAFVRLAFFLPVLGIIEALLASILISAQLLWHETKYFVLPITKIFLALGGVFGPLADYGEPGRSIFLELPASDLFFQVGHFCVRGEFYEMSTVEWIARLSLWTAILCLCNLFFYRFARVRHQSFGG
ncbi:MAG: hypothetical protein AB7T49_00655 [Oligoflexales bacterium]